MFSTSPAFCFKLALLFCCCLFFTSSINCQNCFIEKDGMIIDFTKLDNGTTGYKLTDDYHLVGNYYVLNPCKPIVSTNASCQGVSQGPFQIAYIDNYFDRCFGIGAPGPKVKLFQPNNIKDGDVIVEFDKILNTRTEEWHGAKLFLVCDEKTEFNGKYIGTNKKLFKKEFEHTFKILTKYACARHTVQKQQPKKILSRN